MTDNTAPETPLSSTSFSSSEQPRASAIRRIFIGPQGLRAGWSLLIFILIIVALSSTLRFMLHSLHLVPPPPPKGAPAQPESPLRTFRSEAISLLLVAIATWIMSLVEHRPTSTYGLGGRHKLAQFLAGMAFGVTFLSLLVLTLWKTGLLAFDARLLFGSGILRYGAVWLLGFFCVALFEEYLTRGYLQYTLTRGLTSLYQSAFKTQHGAALGFWTSAVIFSILFGLGHSANPGESPIGLLSAGLVALVFCLSLWRTSSLWWAIGFHTAWDWAQSFLYGVADSGTMIQFHLLGTHPVGKPLLSGGATGPEGSIFVLPILALITIVILFTLVPRGHPGYPSLTNPTSSI